ncbi:MAG TPA: methyltransferase domain-containing protein [Thermoanaerobaculia bacterium]|nr:methyltransferase domain-containing protein [Thermoanaerobaculia bacterium]
MAERDARNPQHHEMSDESMVRTLAAQAELIWPQEVPLFRRYGLAGPIRVLDAGCGTGEITHRLAELYPEAEILGVDLLESHLEEARARYGARYGDRLHFAVADALELELAEASFDLVVCRHMLQSVPDSGRAIRELVRVTRPGGRLHLLCEDYHMIHAEPGALDPDELWRRGAVAFGEAVGTDLRVGRTAYGHLRRAGAREIAVEYVVVDTVRSDRETFARMMAAWRDGFCASIAAETELTEAEACAHFDAIIATIRDPARYAVWHVPIWSARR